jgi:tetratricopeptide (TPR) repeat protein
LTHSAIDNRKSGRLEDAEAGFLKAIRCHSRPAEIRYQYALLLEDMGRSDESVGQLREALSLNPDHAQAHNDLGVHEYRRGREDEALQHLARACTLDPEDSTPLENMAAIHLEAGRDAKALEIYQLLLSRRPDDPDLLHQLGLICNRMGRSGDAAFFWSRVLEIAPDHREARSRLEALPPKGSPAHEHPMEG